METIIACIAKEFIKKIAETLVSGEDFTEIETKVCCEVAQCAAQITDAYLEHLDAAIEADKVGRRKAGYCIERRGDERKLLTQFGEVAYNRTYYKKAAGGYEYLTDSAMGIESRRRVSEGLGLALAEAAKDMSYAKASRHIANGSVSRQSVMWHLRGSETQRLEPADLRRVSELHIDADEAHITLRWAKK